MTKDDKEFFDKALIAMASGATANQFMNWSAYDLINSAKDLLSKRNQFLAAEGYQEPPKAEALPSIFGAQDDRQTACIRNTESVTKYPDGNGETSTGLLIRDILGVARTNTGRRVTATEVYMLLPRPFEPTEGPTINELRDIGRVLRENGYAIRRIGGKDLYQL